MGLPPNMAENVIVKLFRSLNKCTLPQKSRMLIHDNTPGLPFTPCMAQVIFLDLITRGNWMFSNHNFS